MIGLLVAPAGKKFKPAIELPYRWRDWAAQSGDLGDPSSIKQLLAVPYTCGIVTPVKRFDAMFFEKSGVQTGLTG
jgi:hypothetical protein